MSNEILEKRRAKAITLYRQGYKVKDIAELCGVSQPTIWRYLLWITKDRRK